MTNLDQVSQLVVGHTNQVDVAEVKQLTALNAARAVEFPTADQTIKQNTGAAQEWLAASDGEFIDPNDLESMSKGIRIEDIDARRAKRGLHRIRRAWNGGPRRFEGFGELVIGLHLQPI